MNTNSPFVHFRLLYEKRKKKRAERYMPEYDLVIEKDTEWEIDFRNVILQQIDSKLESIVFSILFKDQSLMLLLH